MILWIGIILALVIAVWGSQKGLYDAWTLLFNVIIAVYLGITLSPVLQELLGFDTPAAKIFLMFGTAVICLTILYALSYIIFLSQFEVTFPKALDMAGGGLLGFLSGFLLWSFVAFLIFISPLGENDLLKKVGFNNEKLAGTFSYMQWWTQKVHSVVAAEPETGDMEETVAALIENTKNPGGKSRQEQVSAKPQEQDIKAATAEEELEPNDLGPPPQLEFEDI